ncbi:MAG: hypothetical protein LBT04_02140 [Prevotellaceae bacterium]|nr:hypothetical protein [Prevotellaceae bacterium]
MLPGDEILCRAYDYDGEPQNVDFDTEFFISDQFDDGCTALILTPHEFERITF